MVLSHLLGGTSEFQRQEPISLARTHEFKERNKTKQEEFFFIEDEKGPESILLISLSYI